ncbi:hypothetical protein ACFWUP_12135 [Nocardia sp. NPDC058658]|uniref:hypothetical protein n=1 Tax=Nocardia sp. NPDC058658 TaxID=3346580 RepID=UPI00364CB1BE
MSLITRLTVGALSAGVVLSPFVTTHTAAAQPLSPSITVAPVAVTPVVGSTSADVFCAVLAFLKGGWAGRPGDCTF